VLFVRVLCASAVRVGVRGGCVCLGALRIYPFYPRLRTGLKNKIKNVRVTRGWDYAPPDAI